MAQLTCPKCKGSMEEGYVVDNTHNGFRQSRWMPGEPVASFWLGLKIDKSKLIPVTTFRCKGCGYLDSYAKDQID